MLSEVLKCNSNALGIRGHWAVRLIGMLVTALFSTAAPALVVNGVICDYSETVAGMTACVTQATLDGQPFRLQFTVAGASIDLDGDGLADLIMSQGGDVNGATTTPVSFFRGKGNGKDFASYAPRVLGNGGTVEAFFARHIAVGDFNEDGRPDFFVADATERHDANGLGYGASQYLYVSNGDGSFTKLDAGIGKKIVHGEAVGVPSRDGFGLVLNTPWWVVDGSTNVVDLVSVTAGSSVIARNILYGDPMLGGNVTAPYLTAIDANGDGIRDVVLLGRYGDNSNVILMNDGRGNLSPSRVLANVNMPREKYQAEDAEVGDLNGDGLPDMLVLHIDHTQPGAMFSSLRVWINDGKGGFRDDTATWLGTNLQDYSGGYYDFKIVDLDGDGFPDVVFTAAEPRYSSNRRVVVLRNNAGRSFERLDFGILKFDDWTGGSVVVVPVNGLPTVMYSSNGLVYSLRFLPAPPAPAIVSVVEYHHAAFDHYFITPVAAEIAALDAKTPPFQDWSRTGFSFNAYVNATAPAGSDAICRFFNSSFAPKSSHFYAGHGLGCEDTLRLFPDWGLEDDKLFNTMLPDASTGACPSGTVPVYRLYNSGMGGAPNHRFVTNLSERQNMINKGYVPEGSGIGVGMCVPP